MPAALAVPSSTEEASRVVTLGRGPRTRTPSACRLPRCNRSRRDRDTERKEVAPAPTEAEPGHPPSGPPTSATRGRLVWFPEGNCDTPGGGRWLQPSRQPGRKSRKA